jgi:glycosyltransferase involved in cell wall biosynthesis
MLRLLTTCSTDTFFANAGMAVVERSLIRLLVETNQIQLRVLVQGDDSGFDRLTNMFDDLMRVGKLEFIRMNEIDPRAVFTGLSGIMVHTLTDDFCRLFQSEQVIHQLPVILYIHSLFLVYFEYAFWNEFWHGWSGWPPARIISPSHSNARRVRSLGAQLATVGTKLPSVEVLPHGVDIEFMASGDRRAGRRILGIDYRSPLLLSLNRISPDKSDYRQMLLAFSYLLSSKRIPANTRLAIVGGVAPDDEPYIWALKELSVRLGVNRRVCIFEHLDEDDKPDVLAAADVFISLACNPQESFGVVLLEALAAGLPVVATDWNGYPEVLSAFYRPFLIPTVASHMAARALPWRDLTMAAAPCMAKLLIQLQNMLNQPRLRASLGQWGRDHVKGFSWNATVAQLVSLCQRLDEIYRSNQHEEAASHPYSSPMSPVDGLATCYLEDHPALHLSLASQGRNPKLMEGLRLVADEDALLLLDRIIEKGLPSTNLRDLCTISGLSAEDCDRLVLQLIRYGAIDYASSEESPGLF